VAGACARSSACRATRAFRDGGLAFRGRGRDCRRWVAVRPPGGPPPFAADAVAVAAAVADTAAASPPRQHGLGDRARPPQRRAPPRRRRRHPRWGADEAPPDARGWGRAQRGLGNPPSAARRRVTSCPPAATPRPLPRSPMAGAAPVGGLWRPPGWPPVPQRLQPHPTPLQGRRGGGHHPAGRGAAAPVGRTARRPRRRSGRASARARRPQRRAGAAVATRASAHRRGRLGVGAAPRSVPLPTAAPVRGVSGVPVAARGWQHVVTGGGGGSTPAAGAPLRRPQCGRSAAAEGQLWWAPVVAVLRCA